jgi:hypothetical protein
VYENTVEMRIRTRSKCEFNDDRIGTDQVSMNGIGIESRSHRKDSVMDKKIGSSTEAKAMASDQGTSPVISTAA